jgi:DHA3 family macrolide efflux protein-like MFS transporter
LLLLAILVGLLVGLLAGGRPRALLNVPLRYAGLLIAAVLLRFGTQLLIDRGVSIADDLRQPLYATSFLLLAGLLWLNRAQPGLLVVMTGVAANGLAMALNGGRMPVYVPALAPAGLSASDISATFNVVLPTQLDMGFLLHGGPLADLIPFPLPLLPNVVSIGDVLVALGLGWFVLATLLRGDPDPHPAGISLWAGLASDRPTSTALEPTTLGRPLVLGGGIGPGLAAPDAGAELRLDQPATSASGQITAPAGAPWSVRIRTHPYARLIRDARFSAFWIAQTISLFGDRLNQIAIGALVLAVTKSPQDTALVYLAAMLPNLLFGPFAGTFVDRWDQKRTMIASDLLRALLVLAIPFVAQHNVALVYAAAFLVTSVSLFFRPAKAAVVPRIVADQDLIAANAALWTGETFADIAGYPLAAVLLYLMHGDYALAFWMDAATYVVSAVLIAGLLIPPVVRVAGPRVSGAVGAFLQELREGWGILRDRPPLFQNTLISVVAQLAIGATVALMVAYTAKLVNGVPVPDPTATAAIDTAFGVGNLVGGLVIGALGGRMRKGRLVVLGFVCMGLGTIVLGLSSSPLVQLTAAMTIGVFNLVYVIPTQTLFAELTPTGFMGRVVAIRSSMVFGAMAGAAAVSTLLLAYLSAGAIFAIAGAITVAAGLVATMLPAVRDA